MAKAKTATPEPPEVDLATYTVIEPLRHDGVDYAPGDTIDLDAVAAAPLKAAGVIEPGVIEPAA
jgi:hypothetical protein